MLTIEHCRPLRNGHLPDPRAKKSRSTISSPTLACSRSILCSWLAGFAAAGVERPRRLVLQMPLARGDLARVCLIALGQSGHTRLLAQRFQGALRLQRPINLQQYGSQSRMSLDRLVG